MVKRSGGIGFFKEHLYPHALDAVYGTSLVAIAPYLIATRRARHSYGHVARRRGNVIIDAPGRPRLWIHGVSVGEVLSVRALVRQIQEDHPRWELVFSATSRAGLSVVRNTYPGHATFEYPFDFSWAVRKVLRRVQPDLIIIIEHELWPNFLHRAFIENIPVVMVNCQISDRSILGYRLMSKFLPWPPPAIVHYCAQNTETRERLESLGVSRKSITITGNLKYDNPCEESRDLRPELGISPNSWTLVGASTHEGEEEILLQAFRDLHARDPSTRLVLVPRKTERVGQISRLIQRGGFQVSLRSQSNGKHPVPAGPEVVIVGDTMGELPAFCQAGNVVFVGGTLVPFGGHNVIEPASLGKPVIVGPHSHHIRGVIKDFQVERAITITSNQGEFRHALNQLHGNPQEARAMGARAHQVVQDCRGASHKTAEVLSGLMKEIAAQNRSEVIRQ